MTKEERFALEKVSQMKAENSQGDGVNKVHFGQLEEFGSIGGKNKGGKKNEDAVKQLNQPGHWLYCKTEINKMKNRSYN